VTEHLPKGVEAHRRQKAIPEPLKKRRKAA